MGNISRRFTHNYSYKLMICHTNSNVHPGRDHNDKEVDHRKDHSKAQS